MFGEWVFNWLPGKVYLISDGFLLFFSSEIDMINIFEVFLPQLLRYPNPTDPLNGEAAALLMREPAKYEAKVKGENDEGPSI